MTQVLHAPRIALDSHYIIHWADFACGEYDPKEKELKQSTYENVEGLLDLMMESKLAVGVSERFRADKIQDSDPERKARHLHALKNLRAKGIELIPTTFRFDVGWGSFATDEDRRRERELIDILRPQDITVPLDKRRPNDVVDVDHLDDAIRAGYNVFLTEDNGILKRAKAIGRLGISVASLSEFLAGFDVVSGSSACEGHTQDAECEHA